MRNWLQPPKRSSRPSDERTRLHDLHTWEHPARREKVAREASGPPAFRRLPTLPHGNSLAEQTNPSEHPSAIAAPPVEVLARDDFQP